jgi:hypothetical protein
LSCADGLAVGIGQPAEPTAWPSAQLVSVNGCFSWAHLAGSCADGHAVPTVAGILCRGSVIGRRWPSAQPLLCRRFLCADGSLLGLLEPPAVPTAPTFCRRHSYRPSAPWLCAVVYLPNFSFILIDFAYHSLRSSAMPLSNSMRAVSMLLKVRLFLDFQSPGRHAAKIAYQDFERLLSCAH